MKQNAKIIIAVVLFAVAGVVVAWNAGVFGGKGKASGEESLGEAISESAGTETADQPLPGAGKDRGGGLTVPKF